MDGFVIYQDRAVEYPINKDPTHVVAFKGGSATAVVTVKEVIWVHQNDVLNPVIIYEPVNLSGASLQRASGFNGRFINDNKIGPGAEILITRSGETTIPDVLSIIKPAPGGPQLPDPEIVGQYQWMQIKYN